MFDRFTDRARRVIVFAQDEARALNHPNIGTEHLLLGLVREGEGVAARALQMVDVSLDAVRRGVKEFVEPGGDMSPQHIPFTRACKASLEQAMRQALKLNQPYIGTEHLLLGLMSLETEVATNDIATRVLVELGADQERVCAAVMQLLRGYDVVPPAQLPAVPTQVEVEGEQRLSGITLILPPGVYDTFMERIEPLDPAGPEYRLVLARLLEAQARRQRRLAASLS